MNTAAASYYTTKPVDRRTPPHMYTRLLSKKKNQNRLHSTHTHTEDNFTISSGVQLYTCRMMPEAANIFGGGLIYTPAISDLIYIIHIPPLHPCTIYIVNFI